MSDTPRCNELINKHGFSTTRNGDKAVLVSDYRFSEDAFALARQLERELADARAEIERKNETIDACSIMLRARETLISKQMKLIEQMRESLVAAKNDGKMQSAITYQLIRTAISAAERINE